MLFLSHWFNIYDIWIIIEAINLSHEIFEYEFQLKMQ